MLAFKLPGNFPEVKVARKPGHLGEREVSRKTTAQGKPALLRFTCGPTPVFFVCTGPMGVIGTRLSLRPLLHEGANAMQGSGTSCREDDGLRLCCCLTIESDVSVRPGY